MKSCVLAVMGMSAFLLSGCVQISGWKTVHGSGQITSESRTVSGFNQVALGGSGKLRITQGAEEALTIEADDNLLPLIKSEVSGGVLRIGPEGVNLSPSKTIRYDLHVKDLSSVHLSGSLSAEAASLKTDKLSLHISGSGKIDIGKLEAMTLDTHISGSGDMVVAGQVRDQHVGISGSGGHHAADLRSEQADISVSGSGECVLWVTGSLKTSISGSGSVQYYGSPQVDSHTSGSGKVRGLGNK
jgi:hypothetical protein